MQIAISKLVPLLVMIGIGTHFRGTIKEKAQSFTKASDTVVAKQRMSIILDAAVLAMAAGDELDFNDQAAFRRFAQKGVRQKINARLDSSLDPWGTPMRSRSHPGGLTIYSAGPDRVFMTADDLNATRRPADY